MKNPVIHFLVCSFLFVAVTSTGQSLFQAVTPFGQAVFVNGVSEDPSGHLLVYGETTIGGGPFGGGVDKLVLMKHKPNGQLLWTKYFDSAAEDGIYHMSIAARGDQYALAGFTMGDGTNSRDGLLLLTDTAGVVQQTIRADHTGSNAFHSVAATADGWLLSGRSDGGAGGSYDLQLTGLTAEGALVFSKTFGGSDWDWAYWAEPYADGYLMAGYGDSFGGGFSDPFLVHTDAIGDAIWARSISTPSAEDAMFVTSDSQGNIYLTGYTLGMIPGDSNIKGFVAKLNAGGDLQWCRTVSDWASIPSMAVTPDDRVVLVGDAVAAVGGLGQQDIGLVLLSSDGELIEGYRYGSEASDYVSHILMLADGHLMIAGGSNGFGTANYKPYLLKVTASGLADCNYVPFDFVVTEVDVPLIAPLFSAAEGLSFFDWSVQTENISPTSELLCCPPDAVADFSQLSTSAFVDNSINADEVVWTVNGVEQPAEGNILQIDFQPGGSYEICLTASNACSKDTHCENFVIEPNSVSETEGLRVALFPNPTNGGYALSGFAGAARVTVFDLNGSLVQTNERVVSGQTLPSDLAAGMYLVRVEKSDWVMRLPLMVK